MTKSQTARWFHTAVLTLGLIALTGCFGFRTPNNVDGDEDDSDNQSQVGDSDLQDLFNWQPSNNNANNNDDEEEEDDDDAPPAPTPVALSCNWVALESYPIQVVGTCPIPTSCTASELTVAFPDGDPTQASGLGVYLSGYSITTQYYSVDNTARKFRLNAIFCNYPGQNVEIRFNYTE